MSFPLVVNMEEKMNYSVQLQIRCSLQETFIRNTKNDIEDGTQIEISFMLQRNALRGGSLESDVFKKSGKL